MSTDLQVFADRIHELHLFVEEFRREYTQIHERYPVRVPVRITRVEAEAAFRHYLETRQISVRTA